MYAMDNENDINAAYKKIEDYTELTPLQNFYNSASVFITGGTGFLGKLLIDKLLRSCPTISNIYILVRNKKGKSMDNRIEELFEDVVFERMKQECPKFLHKIVGISGDCSLPGLGLSLQDRRLLTDEVSIIFNVAATVRFDEKIKLATLINVRSARELLELSREMQQLKSFIHVSTAYSNCTNDLITEKIYPPAVDSKQMILLAETVNDEVLDNITPSLLGNYPNTYVFTKQIAEDIVKQEGVNLPVGIFRPAIVVSTYKEPINAWIGNMYGPTGVCAGAGSGLLRTLHCDPEVNANLVPADMCVNSMIASAWEVAETYDVCKKGDKDYAIKVYNYESSNDQPINWRRYMDLAETNGLKTPTNKAIWYYCFNLQKSKILYMLSLFFLHYFPAVLVDTVLFCLGKNPRMLKLYKKVNKFCSVISFFCLRNFRFESHNVQNLLQKMTKKDREIFFSNLKELDWNDYYIDYCKGIRVFLINDPLSTMPEAWVKWKRLYYAHQILKAVVAFLVLRLLWATLSYGLKLVS